MTLTFSSWFLPRCYC
uniref:Uncharacterized protein n=1 Tax=Rhizophora mucronata TaxID=61149 RepID=A0A2P2QKE2_RHIMU